jgi:hypothetical protein
MIARVLGHVDSTVTGIYNRWEYLEEKRTALVKWEGYAKSVLRITGSPERQSSVAGDVLVTLRTRTARRTPGPSP